MTRMTTKLKEVIERVRTWPEDRQEDAAKVLLEMEAQDASSYQLTDEQFAEVRRRRAEKNPETLTPAEFDKNLRRFGRQDRIGTVR
jgi:uncharacterized protein YigA (DUF484 family)